MVPGFQPQCMLSLDTGKENCTWLNPSQHKGLTSYSLQLLKIIQCLAVYGWIKLMQVSLISCVKLQDGVVSLEADLPPTSLPGSLSWPTFCKRRGSFLPLTLPIHQSGKVEPTRELSRGLRYWHSAKVIKPHNYMTDHQDKVMTLGKGSIYQLFKS